MVSIPYSSQSSSSGKEKILSVTVQALKDSGDILAARSVAEDLGLELKTTIIEEDMVEEILPEIIRSVEESGLLQVEVAIPMYLAARLAAEDNIRVMFTGQAADELFAGYPWYNDVLSEFGYLRLHEKLWEDLIILYTIPLKGRTSSQWPIR